MKLDEIELHACKIYDNTTVSSVANDGNFPIFSESCGTWRENY
jgi:hypothetical protein